MIGAHTAIAEDPTAVKARQPIFNRSKRSEEMKFLPLTAHCEYQMLLGPEQGQRLFPYYKTL